MPIDKVTLEILKNHTRAAAESMAYTLYRTAHSTFVKETEDFTTGLTTPEGETFATPTELGATWFVGLNYGRAIAMIDDYRPGDIAMTNDPYSGFVSTHSPDMHIWKPIFHEGEIVAFSVGHIHNTDVGGAVPASLSRTLSEIHQEGVRIPPVKILEEGTLNRQVLDIFLANVRAPDQNWGDLKAQIAACNTGERKVHEMIARFGIETFRDGVADLLDYAEAQARAIVRTLPNGSYPFADYMDEDSVDGRPCRMKLTVIIRDEELIFDFTGSDPQLESSLNMPTGGDERHVLLLVGMTYVLYSLDPSLYLNSGIARVCRCILPSGTMVNPEFSGGGRHAHAQLLPPARAHLRRLRPGGPGPHGGRARFRRADHECQHDRQPHGPPDHGGDQSDERRRRRARDGRRSRRFRRQPGFHEEHADGGQRGGGRHQSAPLRPRPRLRRARPASRRAGHGARVPVILAEHPRHGGATGTGRSLRAGASRAAARGAASKFIRNPGTNREVDLKNTDILTIGPGEVIHVTCGGAGGWGDPFRRDPGAVLLDWRRGWVSTGHAREAYGVVIAGGAVDVPATEALRAARGNGKANGFYDVGPERAAFEAVWTDANYDVLTECLAALPVHWRFYAKHRIFDAIDLLDPPARRGDGSEVRAAFDALRAEFPQLGAGQG